MQEIRIPIVIDLVLNIDLNNILKLHRERVEKEARDDRLAETIVHSEMPIDSRWSKCEKCGLLVSEEMTAEHNEHYCPGNEVKKELSVGSETREAPIGGTIMQPQFYCDICKKGFAKQHGLNIHNAMRHGIRVLKDEASNQKSDDQINMRFDDRVAAKHKEEDASISSKVARCYNRDCDRGGKFVMGTGYSIKGKNFCSLDCHLSWLKNSNEDDD